MKTRPKPQGRKALTSLFAGTLLRRFAFASFLVVLALGVGLAFLLGRIVETDAIDELAQEAVDTLSRRVMHSLQPQDFETPMTGERYKAFQHFVEESIVSERTARIKIWARDGTVVYSDDASQVGQKFPVKDELAAALSGRTASGLSGLQAEENVAEKHFGRLLEVYTPVIFPGSSEVVGAFEIYQFYEHLANRIQALQTSLYAGLAQGFGILYFTLFVIVRRVSRTIERQQRNLEESYAGALRAISVALDLRCKETEGHCERVSRLTVNMARRLGVPEGSLPAVEKAAFLHDVGKIGVSDTILLKPGPLTAEEWVEMRKHTEHGYRLVHSAPFLREAASLVLSHHERYDGAGYPNGLAGEAIPLEARIFAVADSYDAMTSDRPYRKALSHEVAVAEIIKNSGAQFDPRVVAAFLELMRQRPAESLPGGATARA